MCVLSYYTYAKTKTGRVYGTRPHPLTFHIHTLLRSCTVLHLQPKRRDRAMSLVRRSGDTARVHRERGTCVPRREHRGDHAGVITTVKYVRSRVT